MLNESKNVEIICSDCNMGKDVFPQMEEERHIIKVNLPSSEEAYESGNGEGCWCIADSKVSEAYNNDEEKGTYEVILDNDSVYYPGLMAGKKIPIEMRGEQRPVVPISWLVKNYGESWWGKE